jgi:hypothetical protein
LLTQINIEYCSVNRMRVALVKVGGRRLRGLKLSEGPDLRSNSLASRVKCANSFPCQLRRYNYSFCLSYIFAYNPLRLMTQFTSDSIHTHAGNGRDFTCKSGWESPCMSAQRMDATKHQTSCNGSASLVRHGECTFRTKYCAILQCSR